MTLAILAVIVLGAFLVEATLGFGATVVAVALGALVVPIPELLPAFVPLNIALSTWMLVRWRHQVDWRLLLRRILPLMVLGLPAGLLLFDAGGEALLARVFGGFVVVLSAMELWRMARPGDPFRDLSPVGAGLLLVAGGVIHGAFATGGPMAVYVAGRRLPDKGAFRATLSTLWLVLNLVLVAGYALTGDLDAEAGRLLLVLLPGLVLGLAAGEWLHGRVDARLFRVLVFALLAVAGVLLLLGG